MVGSTSANSLHRPHRVTAGSQSARDSASASPLEPNDPQLVAELRSEINALVQEVSQLATRDLSPEEFFTAFLSRIVTAMGAAAGAVWSNDGGGLRALCEVHLDKTNVETSTSSRARHGKLLQAVLAGQQPVVAPPGIGTANNAQAGNPTELLAVLAPLLHESEPFGVVEIFQRPGATPSTQRGYLRFLAQMSDVAASFLRAHKLRQAAENQSLWREAEALVQSLYRSLDVRETAYAVVNDGRRLIGCDRVSLALVYGGRCRIEAVSGLDSIDRRAGEARQLAKLAEAVLQAREPLWSDAGEGNLPPQVQSPLNEYVDRAHARLVAVIPLVRPAKEQSDQPQRGQSQERPFGALIVEQLRDGRASESLRQRSRLVAQHSSAALSHAIEHSSVLLLPLWKALGQATWLLRGSALLKTLAVLGAIAGAAYALAVVPTDFEIAARGKLQPAERREIFAPLDGVVARVPVEHGQIVEAGAVLAELTSTDLDLEIAALIGRQTTNHERLASLERALLDNKGGAARLPPAEEHRLAGEISEQRQEAQNIQRELALLRDKQKKLTIAAPQRGQVITWKVRDLLLQRPVVRGQGLLTLANPEGPWELELHLPERRLTHLQRSAEAARKVNGTPEVSFVLSSHPGQTFRGRVVEIEQSAEVRGDEGNTVLVRVAVEKSELPPLHDQTTVTAKIDCGRTSLGYAWFCDLVETVQTHVLFWLPS